MSLTGSGSGGFLMRANFPPNDGHSGRKWIEMGPEARDDERTHEGLFSEAPEEDFLHTASDRYGQEFDVGEGD